MSYPDNLKYTEDHEWVKVEGDIAIVGVTHHAQSELGDIVYIDIPDDEADLSKGDTFGTIEAVKTVADLLSPVSGKITEINEGLNDAPEAVNNDPYESGWIAKIQMSDASELDGLLSASAYEEFIGQ